MVKRRTQRVMSAMRVRLGVLTLVAIAFVCLMVSPVLADSYTRWFDPILLTASGSTGYMEVVLQVSPGVAPGPYEYVYWVTNYAPVSLSDFYFTCVGIPDPSSFDPTAYRVMDGTRNPQPGGGVQFWWGAPNLDWGNLITGEPMVPIIRQRDVYDATSDAVVGSTKFRWSSLAGDGLLPGDSLGYSFTSIYAPSAVARDLAAGLAIRTYNGDEYAYGPDITSNDVPEWSSALMALLGFGGVGALRRRFTTR